MAVEVAFFGPEAEVDVGRVIGGVSPMHVGMDRPGGVFRAEFIGGSGMYRL